MGIHVTYNINTNYKFDSGHPAIFDRIAVHKYVYIVRAFYILVVLY